MNIFPVEVQKYVQTIPKMAMRNYAIAYSLYCVQGRQRKVKAEHYGLQDGQTAAKVRNEVERLLREASK